MYSLSYYATRTLFQACRVVTNVVSLYLPRFSHLTGSLAGLAGFAIVLVNDDKDNLARLPGCTSKATALAGCFAATALSHWMCPPQATATAKGHRPVYTPHLHAYTKAREGLSC